MKWKRYHNRDKFIDLTILLIIVGSALIVAYVTFGILNSQADAEIQKYSLGGAIVGFLITFSTFISTYTQFRRSSLDVQELYRQISELQNKLMKGAPKPSSEFIIESDERQRIVLARPEKWECAGGVIFDYEIPLCNLTREEDVFPAHFRVSFKPIKDSEKPEEYYMHYIEKIKNKKSVAGEECTNEYIYLGGEYDNIKSLKIIAKQYAKCKLEVDPWTGIQKHDEIPITKDEYERGLMESHKKFEKSPNSKQKNKSIEKYLELLQIVIVCYHEKLNNIFYFEFIDDSPDFIASSEKFNQIINSIRFLD